MTTTGKSFDKANFLEKTAAGYVESRNGCDDHDLKPRSFEQLAALKKVERRAVVWAAVAGAVAGAILGTFEIIVMQGRLDNPENMELMEKIPYWAAYFGFVVVVSAFEVLFLYWNSLRATAAASRIAGLGLARKERRSALLSHGLGRAAIEIPNPIREIYGIDPYSRTSRWKIWFWRFVYRLKVGVSSFVIRVFLNKLLMRVTFRLLIPLFAGPLYATWNAIIAWRVAKEVRARSFGLYAIAEFEKRIGRAGDLSPKAGPLIIAAVGEILMCSRDAHPNFDLLVERLLEIFSLNPEDINTDWKSMEQDLKLLGSAGASLLLEAMILASFLDGKITRSEILVIERAHILLGREFNPETLDYALSRFMNGQPPSSSSTPASSS